MTRMADNQDATGTRVRPTDPVVLAQWWVKTPTIHQRAYGKNWDETACGRQIGRYWPIVRYDHAQKIGAECRRCFR